MDLRIQVPGLSYFSFGIVLGLRRHALWSFWVNLREEGYAPLVSPVAMPGMPKSDRRPVWRRRRFFISSVDDSGLERSAALESLCFGIGFGRLELNCNYFCYIIMLCFLNDIFLLLYVIVISTCPLHPLPGWYDIVAELQLIRARTGATPCVR